MRQGGRDQERVARIAQLRQIAPQQGWADTVAGILAACNDRHSLKQKEVGFRTKSNRSDIIFMAFRRLHDLGMKISNPFRIEPRHVNALISAWRQDGLAPATMQTRLYILRTFCRWIGREGVVPETRTLGDDFARTYAATSDKSWSAKEIDVEEVVRRIAEYDACAATWIELAAKFGLRKQEAMLLDPGRVVNGSLVVFRGTKGGRQRLVPVRTEEQSMALRSAAAIYAENEGSLIPQGMSLKQGIRRFNHVLAKEGITKAELGATLHGLRAEYACDRLEDMGMVAPVRGGTLPQESSDAIVHVMEELGHSRENIGRSYYGGDKKPKPPRANDGGGSK